MKQKLKSYNELKMLNSFEERYSYLRTGGTVGQDTFGSNRHLNQVLYKSPEWKKTRRQIILRDGGCDLGDPERVIPDGAKIIVHHINPITIEDIYNRDPSIFDPNNLISVSEETHNAIHFGDSSLLPKDPIERFPNDQCPWRH